jgi:glycosyltransferase involved in cell wall biosynthesis
MKVLDGEVDPTLIPDVMNAADCLLVTSDSEGSPTVIQEALATNLPVVSVDTGDAVERMAGVANARIAARDPVALSRALVELTTVPRRSNGRDKAKEFSLRCIARQLVGLYTDLSSRRAHLNRSETNQTAWER